LPRKNIVKSKMRNLYIVLIILFVIIYFVFPFDIFPDFLGLPGRVDDLSLIGLAIWFIRKRLSGKRKGFKKPFWQNNAKGSGTWQGQKGGNDQQYNYKENAEKKTAEEERRSSSDPYVILNVRRNATENEIKKAYKELLKKYHPDKVAFLGEEFQQIAHKKMVEIQRAYDTLINK